MFLQIKVRIVERAAEERDGIMASGAPPGSLHIAIARQGDLPGLLYAEKISLVIKRAEMMHAVEPVLVSILVALAAILVRLQRVRRDELPGGGPRERRLEIDRP